MGMACWFWISRYSNALGLIVYLWGKNTWLMLGILKYKMLPIKTKVRMDSFGDLLKSTNQLLITGLF
jgi:hypothetical protein